MKKILLGIIVIGAVFLLSFTTAQATPFSFDDNTIYWGDWDKTDTPDLWGNGTSDDTTDSIGSPSIIGGGGAIVTGGVLSSVYFEYGSYNPLITAGDLFIDTDADEYWDYIVDTSSANNDIYYYSSGVGLYDTTAYILSNTYFDDENYREDHPVEVAYAGTDVGDASFTDFNSSLSDVVFSNLNITLSGTEFIIGFAPTCANDVIYEKIPISEPATVLLLGTGLVGLSVFGRKRFFK
jgi:hypothetical protein